MADFSSMVVLKNPGASRGFRILKANADRMQKELGCVTAGRHTNGLRWESADGIAVVHFEIRDTVRHLYILPSGSTSWKNHWALKELSRVVESRGCFKSIRGPFAEDDSWVKEVFRL
jgi:hypothetical protein